MPTCANTRATGGFYINHDEPSTLYSYTGSTHHTRSSGAFIGVLASMSASRAAALPLVVGPRRSFGLPELGVDSG